MTLITAATGSCISATLPRPAISAAAMVASFCIWLKAAGTVITVPVSRIVSDLFRQISEKNAQDLRGALLRRHGEVDGRELDRRAGAHQPLEQRRRVVRVAGGIVVGALAHILVAALVDEDGRGGDVVLVGALVQA